MALLLITLAPPGKEETDAALRKTKPTLRRDHLHAGILRVIGRAKCHEGEKL
jgi:hypothetical protein